MTETQITAARAAYLTYLSATFDPRWPELIHFHEAVARQKANEAAVSILNRREG